MCIYTHILYTDVCEIEKVWVIQLLIVFGWRLGKFLNHGYCYYFTILIHVKLHDNTGNIFILIDWVHDTPWKGRVRTCIDTCTYTYQHAYTYTYSNVINLDTYNIISPPPPPPPPPPHTHTQTHTQTHIHILGARRTIAPHHTHTHIRCPEDYSQWNCFLLCWNICLIFQGEHLTQQQIAGNWNNFISVTSHERYCVSITGDWTICSIFAHADNIKNSPSTAIVRNLPMANRFPSQRARNAESVFMSWPLHKYIVGTSAYTIIMKSRKYSIINFDWQKSSMIRQCEVHVRGKAFIMIEKDIDWSEYCRRILLKNKRAIETDLY